MALLPRRVSRQTFGRYTFDADFDSGNLARVEPVAGSADEFNVWTAADCSGTPFQATSKTWFHFSVAGGVKGSWLTLTVFNMNVQTRLYKNDFRPVYRNGTSGPWQRIRSPASYKLTSKADDDFRLTFRHRFESEDEAEPVYFAFAYPWSYAECQSMLDRLSLAHVDGAAVPEDAEADAPAQEAAASVPAAAAPAPAPAPAQATASHGAGAGAAATGGAGRREPPAPERASRPAATDIYFARELLTTSLEGRRVELLTITSHRGRREEREAGIDGLFPEGGPRPHAFDGKPTFVLSARVHPGETPASHVLNGFVELLLRPADPRARALRDRFVFKVVPCLNPDGVFHGFYRTDTRGVNLNRCYVQPSPAEQPSIYALRALIEQLHACGVFGFHVDLHGHATKRGCFLFGNSVPNLDEQISVVLYAKLVSLNSQFLEFGQCVFSQRNMVRKDRRDGLSKEGSSRVALYRATGVPHCYTLECNYNSGRALNRLGEGAGGSGGGRLSPPTVPPGTLAPKYTPATWGEVGRALAYALLDLRGCNPISRLPGPSSAAAPLRLEAIRGWCAAHVRTLIKQQAQQQLEAGSDGEGSATDSADLAGPGAAAALARHASSTGVRADSRPLAARQRSDELLGERRARPVRLNSMPHVPSAKAGSAGTAIPLPVTMGGARGARGSVGGARAAPSRPTPPVLIQPPLRRSNTLPAAPASRIPVPRKPALPTALGHAPVSVTVGAQAGRARADSQPAVPRVSQPARIVTRVPG